MEKLSHTTESILDENVEKLAELFPEVVTEVREPDGSLRHTIDVDALRGCVGDVAEGQRERYQFTWPGKREAKQEAYRQIDKCLRPCPEESVNWDTTGNLYIEGDNLDALKLLRNTYAGKVKMIYIDPPYNTGHDFIYDDDFTRTKADYDAESGDYDEEGGRLVANPESNGRFHSDWCSMMYPRLLLARDLLSEDGLLFVSIDDSEAANARKLLDDVFGQQGFITQFCWEKTQHFGRQRKNCYNNVDYVLCYARQISSDGIKELLVERVKTELEDAPLYNASNNVSTLTFPPKSVKFNLPDGRYRETTSEDYELLDEVAVVDGWNSNTFRLVFRSRWSADTVLREVEKGTRYWVKTQKFAIRAIYADGKAALESPRQLLFTNKNNPACTYSRFGDKVDTSELASAETERLIGDVFSYPKPPSLIAYFASLLWKEGTRLHDNEGIILDFFSGSATTAHSVMQLNAEDGGNRKFIMVQLPEACDERSEAAKAGYENICEIGKERIRRAGRKIAAEVEEQNRQPKLGEEPKKVPDIGFRVLKIDSSNFEDVSAEPAEYTQQTLAGLADNLKPGRTAEDLLFQVMPQFQIPLSAKIEKRNVNGSTVFSVDDGRLVACFDRNVATETIVAMAKSQPDYAVMRDASFTGDDAVSNFGELFKTYSSATFTRVV